MAAIKPVERICCVCHRLQPTTQMTRVVCFRGVFTVQVDKYLDGRGSYVCAGCRTNPAVGKALSRSFRQTVPATLVQELTGGYGAVKMK